MVIIMAINFVQIGKHIGEIRKRRGLSQQKLSEIIDKSPTYVSYIEGGLKCMSLDTFVSIANALQVSADELLKDNIENNIKVANHEFASLIAGLQRIREASPSIDVEDSKDSHAGEPPPSDDSA